MQYEFKENTNHELLKKYNNINKKLSDDRVLTVCYKQEDGKFYLVEGCDDYFDHELTKDDCLELANLFKDLADLL